MSRSRDIRVLGKTLELLAGDSQDLYVMFVDLCNSTRFKQALLDAGLSDSIWLTRELVFLHLCAKQVKDSGGTVVKTLGDGIMATYDYSESAKDILHSCVEMVRAFDNLKTYKGKDKIEVKISVDYGETINGAVTGRNYDPLGLCVDRCARLNSSAGPREIAFSNEFNEKLPEDKTTIHPLIKKVKRRQRDLKGIGNIPYYLIILS